jgi:polyisoprenyl-teichoic acid--peptidoglycan teichoic acid transferase
MPGQIKNRFDRWIVWVCGGLLFCVVVISAFSPVVSALTKYKRINLILLGTDWVDYCRHSDTLMFISYEPRTRFLDILSIPRDTRIQLPGLDLHRINEVYAYNYRISKRDEDVACRKVCDAVEWLFSQASSGTIKAPYYIQVNYQGFKNIIDIIGGVTVNVEEPMHYDDFNGKLHIHFSTGTHHLDGQKALEYVRYRGQSGDRGRIFRQQRFMNTMIAKFKNPLILGQIPQIFYQILVNVRTNFSWWDLVCFAWDARLLSRDNIRFLELPGKPHAKGRYWLPDEERIASVVELLTTRVDAPAEVKRHETRKQNDEKRVIVEVFNGSGKRQLAWKVTQKLRRAGFDVVSWGNYENIQKTTLVIDRTGDIRAAQAVAEKLSSAEIVSRIDKSKLVDITVIIGQNYIQEE